MRDKTGLIVKIGLPVLFIVGMTVIAALLNNIPIWFQNAIGTLLALFVIGLMLVAGYSILRGLIK